MATILVNGINLNTLGYQVDVLTGRSVVPIRRDYSQQLPGVHGDTGAVGPFDTQVIGIEAWVDDADPTTGARSNGWDTYRRNLSRVASAFVRPDGKVRVSVTDSDGVTKIAIGVLTGYIADEDNWRVKAAIRVPAIFWRGPDLLSFTSTTFGTEVEIEPLATAESNAPISDMLFTVYGPLVNPTILDVQSNLIVQYQGGTLAAGDRWVYDGALRTSKKITSANVTTSVVSQTKFVPTFLGAPALELWPAAYDLANPYAYKVNVSATTVNPGASWQVEAKPAYY